MLLFGTFLQKSLHISKKSITFAVAKVNNKFLIVMQPHLYSAEEQKATESYLYERAEKRFQEMKAGRYINHEDSMAFIREYAQQTQAVAV